MNPFGDDEEMDAVEATMMSDRVRAAFRSIPPAPLKTTIEEFLAATPGYAGSDWLRRIAALNQGAVEDLDEAEFKSYVICRTGLSEAQLLKCRLALRSLAETRKQMAADPVRDLLVAARGDEAEPSTAAELFEQLKKREG
jgi:hypothetical protein